MYFQMVSQKLCQNSASAWGSLEERNFPSSPMNMTIIVFLRKYCVNNLNVPRPRLLSSPGYPPAFASLLPTGVFHVLHPVNLTAFIFVKPQRAD
jgi:hypothetical protein